MASEKNFVDPAFIQVTLTEVSTQRQVDEKIAIIKRQEKDDQRLVVLYTKTKPRSFSYFILFTVISLLLLPLVLLRGGR